MKNENSKDNVALNKESDKIKVSQKNKKALN
jgi:hypothetical protein